MRSVRNFSVGAAFIVGGLALSGCAAMMKDYTALSGVRVREDRTYEPVGSAGFGAEDADVKITYTPDITDSSINFFLVNKSNEVVRIIWDESSFIEGTGQSSKVFHNGVTIKDRSQSLPPSVVPPGANLSESIVPNDRVSFGQSGWDYTPICGTKSVWDHSLKDDDCIGKTFGVFLTYQVGDKKKNATMRFKYVSKKPKASEEKKPST